MGTLPTINTPTCEQKYILGANKERLKTKTRKQQRLILFSLINALFHGKNVKHVSWLHAVFDLHYPAAKHPRDETEMAAEPSWLGIWQRCSAEEFGFVSVPQTPFNRLGIPPFPTHTFLDIK